MRSTLTRRTRNQYMLNKRYIGWSTLSRREPNKYARRRTICTQKRPGRMKFYLFCGCSVAVVARHSPLKSHDVRPTVTNVRGSLGWIRRGTAEISLSLPVDTLYHGRINSYFAATILYRQPFCNSCW